MTIQHTRCLSPGFEDDGTLYELAHLRSRSLKDLLKLIEQGDIDLRHRARRSARKRLSDEQRDQMAYLQGMGKSEGRLPPQAMQGIAEGLNIADLVESPVSEPMAAASAPSLDESTVHPDDVTVDDVEESLQEYIRRGELEIERGKVQFTPKGARKLASQVLTRVMKNLAESQVGPHDTDQYGYGGWLSTTSRRHEVGDEYHKVDFERTLFNALERGSRGRTGLRLQPQDFFVHDEVQETRMVAGLLVDQSGSITGEKFSAAIDTSLALAEIIRRDPEDMLKVYFFSYYVQEIPHYDIVNTNIAQGFTDIRAALRTFRTRTSNADGDRQAYLITDAEPNTEHGTYVGFDKAAAGVMQEALLYREASITLNLIMLDQSPKLRQLASMLARHNLGRVFFTSPRELGQLIVEDYLTCKKRQRPI